MSENNRNLVIDFLPRAIAIIVIITAAIAYNAHLSSDDVNSWKSKIKQANEQTLTAFNQQLSQTLDTATNLAYDERLQPLFDTKYDLSQEAPALSRRAIYEFKYINEIDHAYVFSTTLEAVVLKTAGSPDLAINILQPYFTAAQEKLPHLTNISLIGGQAYIVAGKPIYNQTGQIIGYAITTQNTQNFFGQIAKSIPLTNLSYDAFMVNNGEAITVENFTITSSSLRINTPNTVTFPIFDGAFEPTQYQKDNTEILATGNHLTDKPKWNIATYVDMSVVNATSDKHKTLTMILSLIATIITFLIPIKGAYSDTLKNLYRQAGLLPKPKKPEPSLNMADVDRMRQEIEAENKQLEEQAKKNAEILKEKAKKDYKPSDAVIAYNIRTGMKNRRIKLLYQPIFTTNTEEVAMYEVYLRIIDDEGKVMPPSLWLPVAQKEDLFSLIDETVVSVAVDKFFIRPNPLRISLAFNISGGTFSSLEFLKTLMASSNSQYPVAEHTIFELRSREIIEDKRAMNFIKECREMGFRFSIDYFGGGAQTLKAAKTLKFDFVKIDVLKFNLDKKEDQTEFVKLVKTAEAIDLPLVIEKIEDERTLRFCKRIGVKFAQGYHLSEPSADLITKRQ